MTPKMEKKALVFTQAVKITKNSVSCKSCHVDVAYFWNGSPKKNEYIEWMKFSNGKLDFLNSLKEEGKDKEE